MLSDDRNDDGDGTIEQISARGMRVITNVIVVPQRFSVSLSFSTCLTLVGSKKNYRQCSFFLLFLDDVKSLSINRHVPTFL